MGGKQEIKLVRPRTWAEFVGLGVFFSFVAVSSFVNDVECLAREWGAQVTLVTYGC